MRRDNKKADSVPSAPPRAGADFPIQDYAALGDGRSVALVAPDGAIAWWCVPEMDSPPLFDMLLNPSGGGYFAVHAQGAKVVERRYRTDSNVLETILATPQGRARLTESLNSSTAGRLPWCELARRIEVLDGSMSFQITLVLGTRGDTASPWLQPTPAGCVFHVGPVLGFLRYSDNIHITGEADDTITAAVTLAAGERAIVALIAGENEPLAVPPVAEIDDRIDVSDEAWRRWAEALHYHGPHRHAVRRSALALKLLLYSPSGAIAAAATSSLPEKLGSVKNFDYRYAWIRDAGYAVNAFLRVGAMAEAKAAFSWLMKCLDTHGPQVLYTLNGDLVAEEHEVGMAGYRSAQSVLVGNDATRQHQHGIYGDIFETASLFVNMGNILDQKSAFILCALADQAADRWRQPDAGIWELREPQHFTMSKISAWQGLARAVEMSEAGHLQSTCTPRWRRERDRIAAWIQAHCWSDQRGAYLMHPETDRLDASLALAVRFGFDGAARLSRTMDAIRCELGAGGFVYRFSGADQEEGAFIACSFWLAEALAELGRTSEAEEIFAKAAALSADHVGILSEMVDPETGDFLGNTPQGLSHLALIHAACSLGGGTIRRPG